MDNKFMVLDIQHFADGGAEGAGTAATATVGQSQTTGETGAEGASAEGASAAGELGGVADEGTEQVTLDSIFEKYPELKKEADKRAQKAVKSRVHQINKSMQPTNNIIDKLMAFHGTKSIEELQSKLDKTISDEFAIQNGVSNDIGDEMLNHRIKDAQEERYRVRYEQEMKAERQFQRWQAEAKEVKGVYADFDLNAELENPDFVKLISVPNEQYRMPMRQIYELIHHDEMIKAAEKRAADAYSRSVNANLSRPSENGTGNQSAVSGANDVSKLTKKERADLAKRAAKGETITLR